MRSSVTRERASLAQHGLWLTERTGAGGGAAHHLPLAVHLEGPLDEAALRDACAAVAARHPVLAAALVEEDGELRLVPGAAGPPFTVADVAEGDVPAAVDAEVARPFDLSAGPLARFALFRLEPKRHLLLVVAHHAAFDGMSKDLLLHDLAAAYGGSLPAPPATSHGEAAAGEHDRVAAKLAAAAEFWRPRWNDGGGLLLPGLRRVSLRAAPGGTVDVALGSGPGAALGPAAERIGVTRFELLLAALHTLLYGYGNTPATVSVDVSTRTERTREQVGMFVNELPVTASPDGTSAPDGTFAAFARSVRDELRAAYRFREVPVARALGGVSPRASLTPVSLSYRRRGEDPLFPGLGSRVEWTMPAGAVRGTLHLQVVEAPDGVTAHLRFDPGCLDRASCEAVAGHLTALLRAVAARPDALITELPLPPRQQAAPGTASGTVPAPGAGAGPVSTAASTAGTAPAGAASAGGSPVVDEVLEIWREVLGFDDITPDDDLFDLGGHSLSITQIIARVRDRMGVELSFEVFIDTPTAAGVAADVERLREEAC
ncbi:condensation domain-containing protein [Planomonospora corallina]|uniref:Condensation domain-containing protein n=1 Tax=Planomonospora corallina TaxID=1806052 RepID=A0ABV8II30_9ACTN